MGCGDVRLLRTIGGVDVTGQERATLNKLTMPRAILGYVVVGRFLSPAENIDRVATEPWNLILYRSFGRWKESS